MNQQAIDNGNRLAYPHKWVEITTTMVAMGLTKREDFAKAAMQGLLSSPGFKNFAREEIVGASIIMADLLLEELEKT